MADEVKNEVVKEKSVKNELIPDVYGDAIRKIKNILSKRGESVDPIVIHEIEKVVEKI